MKKKILIVIADYYKDITDGLLKSALKLISNKNNIKVINVPGAFEIPVTISKNINKHDAFLALGCVIKGQTPHFDFISQAATNGIMELSISSKKPIGNGTCRLIPSSFFGLSALLLRNTSIRVRFQFANTPVYFPWSS